MSEPPSKIAKHDSISSLSYEMEKEEWFVVLCYDILLEVLRCGNRRQLVSVERVGRRIHRIVENYFVETPFLRLNLLLNPRQFEHGLKAFSGNSDIEMTLLNTASFPPFFRFGRVEINTSISGSILDGGLESQDWDTQPIAGKCKLFEDQLKLMKPALNGSLVSFNGYINNEMQSCFNDHDQVLEYLRNQLLPSCDKSREFEFYIEFYSDEGSATNIIASILQMEEVKSCSSVSIFFWFGVPTKFPVDRISNWLNRSCDEIGQRERYLFIHTSEVESFFEVFSHLKETFQEAKSPVRPWTFILLFEECDDEEKVEEQTLTNKITNEEMSVNKMDHGDTSSIEIIRAAKKKKN